MKAPKMRFVALFIAMAITAGTSHAQVLNVLHTFSAGTNSPGFLTNWDGSRPISDMVLCGNTLYGTAALGGVHGQGTIFSMNTNGSGFTILHAFTGTNDGAGLCTHLLLE